MARAKRKKTKAPAIDRVLPTLEQLASGEFVSAGMSMRRVPMIEMMHKRGQLTEEEYRRLGYYRDQASVADRSGVKSCLDREIGNGGDGPGAAVVSAMIETGRIERDLGSLWEIARAVAVDDISLTQWCINQHGGRERYNGAGEFIAMVPVCELKVMRIALMDLKMAARRIVR